MSRPKVILLTLLTVSQRVTLQDIENKSNTESWYAANSESNFSPKSISELFTTEQTYSSTNPTIVPQSSTQVPPVEVVNRYPVPQSSGTPLPYSIQTLLPQTQYSTQAIKIQTTLPTIPIQIQSIETTIQPQSVAIQTVQPPSNSQSQTPFSQIPIDSNNQIHNIQTYQLVPIVKSTPIHPIPVYQTLSSSPSLTPQTTLEPTTHSKLLCSNRTKAYSQVRIKMSSPRGITNISINPVSVTKRRTNVNTKESSKRQNKNDYDECVKVCGDGKKRVCAAPAGASAGGTTIDPDTLRGFPSICHLACHNNFKNSKYEKLLDGRCGRLRTRIRLIDSNSKLKRTELNKLQYHIVQEPQTVIEFAPTAQA